MGSPVDSPSCCSTPKTWRTLSRHDVRDHDAPHPISKLLDLVTPRALRAKTWLQLDKLLAEDWQKVSDAKHESQSQAFGRASQAIGAEALLVPSARVPGGLNLVYFPQSLARASADH